MGQSTAGARGIFGKIFLTLFLSVFLGVGLWLSYLTALGLLHQFETYSWPELSCTVLSSTVEEHPGAPEADESYIFRVRYRWETDGAAGASDVYRSGYGGSSDIGSALRLARYYAVGAEVPCWVNPERADSALLELESAWSVLVIFFPLIFVAVGGGGIALVWKGTGSKSSRTRRSISSRASTNKFPGGCLAGFFSIFLLAGLAFLIPFFLLPAYDTWRAAEWSEVPCTVEYSSVRTHTGDDSSTYSVDVLYSYEISGTLYKSSRFDLFSGSDSEYGSKQAFVDQHPAGTRTTCFVDPEEPLNAILNRDYSGHLLWALIPLVFVLVGGVGVAWALLGSRTRHPGRDAAALGGAWLPDQTAGMGSEYGVGPKILRPAATPFRRLLGGIGLAVFWNGITGIFVWVAFQAWISGEGAGCLSIFLIPFVLIGILLLVNIPYQILASFNPRPEMSLESHRLSPGQDSSLSWQFQGAAGRIRRLRITLEGSEKVTYRRGTNTHRDSNTFTTLTILELAAPERLEAGRVQFSIPAGSMHSFQAPNNQVVWTLKLHGEIRVWPDVAEEFQIQVDPGD